LDAVTGGEGVIGSVTGLATCSGATLGSGVAMGMGLGLWVTGGADLGLTTEICDAQDASSTMLPRATHLQKAALRSGFVKASRSSVWAFSKPSSRSRVIRCCVHRRDSILSA
jgi:hypothetical protein